MINERLDALKEIIENEKFYEDMHNCILFIFSK